MGACEDHVWDVYGFLAYRVGSRADAEDLTQVTFEKALRSWSRFDPRKASAKTWLLTIARNALTDHLRRERPKEAAAVSGDAVGEDALPSTPAAEPVGLSPELERALTDLGQKQREVIALRFGGDMTGAEIADTLGISLADVQQTLSRALRRLRDELEPD